MRFLFVNNYPMEQARSEWKEARYSRHGSIIFLSRTDMDELESQFGPFGLKVKASMIL